MAPMPSESALKADLNSYDIQLKLEHALAHLLDKSYNLCNTAKIFQRHPLFTVAHSNKIEAIERVLKGPSIGVIGMHLYIEPEKAFETAKRFISELESAAGDSKEVKTASTKKDLDLKTGLSQLSAQINALLKQYKQFKPVLKDETLTEKVGSALLLNNIIRPVTFADYNNLTTIIPYFTNMVTFGAILKEKMNAQKTQSYTQQAKEAVHAVAIPVAAQLAQLVIAGNLPKLDAYKKKLLSREYHTENKKQIAQLKKRMHQYADYFGGGPGFSQLEGIHDEQTLQTFKKYADWLNHSIKYHGYGNQEAILMHGKPGNGKSFLTEALSNETGTPIINISPEVAQDEKKLEEKIAIGKMIARRQPNKAIIFNFDEIDLATSNRIANGEKQQISTSKERSLFSLLTLLAGVSSEDKGIRVLYMFSTNYIQHLDIALKRPGRISDIVSIGAPNKAQRTSQLNQLLGAEQQDESSELAKIITQAAEQTEGFDRSDINEITKKAHKRARFKNHPTPTIEDIFYGIENIRTNKEQSTSSD